MPAWELERDNSDEDFENDEREDRGPVENDEEYDEDRAAFYREANREYARRGAFPKYDPNTPLHF